MRIIGGKANHSEIESVSDSIRNTQLLNFCIECLRTSFDHA
jgi:hypothetical protein